MCQVQRKTNDLDTVLSVVFDGRHNHPLTEEEILEVHEAHGSLNEELPPPKVENI